MIQALTMLLALTLSGPAAPARAVTLAGKAAAVDTLGRARYARAIDCAAGEATLAALLGENSADDADRATVARVDTLAQQWLQTALTRAPSAAVARADLARSKAALAAKLGMVRDPAALTAVLGERLATCGKTDPGTIG